MVMVLACTPVFAQEGSEAPQEKPHPCIDSISSTPTITMFVVGTFTAAILSVEEDSGPIRKSLDGPGCSVPLEIGNFSGSGWGVGGMGLLTLSYGKMSGNQGFEDLGSDLAVSFLVTSALTISLKYGIDRKRPNGAPYSMPSGHTSGAFSSVPVIWHHLGWQTGLAFGSISTLTALARIEDNKHYTSDVVAGATLGLVVGRLVIARRNVCDWQVNATPGSLVVSRAF
jgi:hypothetical protein